ncbi:hypothetical protein [Streptomyces sp. SLBN-8D4]|uniref:hypothetical protein n=1 Tax=Streptomyces sp. SLBN-8D4 TaxID=3377728 RepID=UPI003C7CC714
MLWFSGGAGPVSGRRLADRIEHIDGQDRVRGGESGAKSHRAGPTLRTGHAGGDDLADRVEHMGGEDDLRGGELGVDGVDRAGSHGGDDRVEHTGPAGRCPQP